MKKSAIYSRSGRRQGSPSGGQAVTPSPTPFTANESPSAPATEHPSTPLKPVGERWRHRRWRRPFLMTLVTAAMALLGTYWGAREAQRGLAQGHTSTGAELKAIDSEMRQSLLQRPLPSAVSRAYEQVIPSVVRVTGYANTSWPTKGPEPTPDGVGTGVVIVDNGTILTNLHVVRKAKRLKVMFFDGHESEAEVIHEDPSSDLAMLRAKSIPDDLQAATLRSSTSLRPGDEILTIGFPFGIGPSVSSGVVSGLGREYRSPDGQQTINNLIQFDAVANPGNSGGPLVTLEGDVVGVVTAILNPSQQRVFIGIGFAMPIENASKGAGPSPF